ncbi:MAG: DUF4382 domain-containing protein [Spirochaetes bacterium]|nr:DUF4382 domain-containing protein [Spirochaetota bacterium]
MTIIKNILLILLFVFFNCSNNDLENREECRVVVRIHDFPLNNVEIKDVILQVKEINLLSENGNIVNIMNTLKEINILSVTENNPVLLSDITIPSGIYTQVRLVLSNNNKIIVGNEEFELKIPSGEQSGLKFDGSFNLQNGKLFEFTFDFIASESIVYNEGVGYILKPVIKLLTSNDILGIFSGNVKIDNVPGMMVFKLNRDNSIRVLLSNYPNDIFIGSYYYNINNQKFQININKMNETDINIEEIIFNVSEWSENKLNFTGDNGKPIIFYKVNYFSIDSITSMTKMDLTINLVDNSRDNFECIGVLQYEENFIETDRLVYPSTFTKSKICGNLIKMSLYIDNKIYKNYTVLPFRLIVFIKEKFEEKDFFVSDYGNLIVLNYLQRIPDYKKNNIYYFDININAGEGNVFTYNE